MGFFDDLLGGAGKEAAEKNRQLSEEYRSAGMGYLDSGLSSSKGYLDQAVGAFTPLSDLASKYGAGTSLYLDALGANGADGSARASSAFQTSPGYQFNLEQGLEGINRRRAAGGMLDSGNADIDAMKYASGLASGEYSNWLNNLSGLVSPELSATSGAATGTAAGLGSLANLYQTDATNRIGLQGGYTSGMMSANNQEAEAKSKGAGNLLNLGLNVASMAMGLPPMGSMFSGGGAR